MHVSIGLGLVNLVIQCYDKKIKIRILGFLGGRDSNYVKDWCEFRDS
jgi:hypothetical protein